MSRLYDNLNSNAGAKRAPISRPVGDRIIYLSQDGCEENGGLTPDAPRYDIKRVPEYLKEGYSVLLKAGSRWYVPNFAWKLYDINATEDEPLLVGTYGEGEPPVVADMYALYPADWKSEGKGIISATVPGDVYRLYISDILWVETENEAELADERFVQKNGRVYIKAEKAPEITELIAVIDGKDGDFALRFKNISYITLQNFIIKGGDWCTVYGNAPSDHFTIDHMELRSMYKYCIGVGANAEDKSAYNNALTITNCIIDRTHSLAMQNCFRKKTVYERTTDGIFLSNAHINAYIAGNIVCDFGHTAINLESLSLDYVGIHNCIIERNVINGTKSEYLRACETIGAEGKCTNNIFRYNYCYDLTNSSHLLGENNKYYCNVFSNIKTLLPKLNEQAFAIDSMTWHYKDFEFVARGNIIANNTIHNCNGSLQFMGNTYTNTVVNNIFTGWENDGAIQWSSVKEELEIKNNCFFCNENNCAAFGDGIGKELTVDGLNERDLCSGNIFTDPEYTDSEKDNYTIKSTSPCANAGLPLSEFIEEPYLDINGNPFDNEHPSVGAFSVK